MNILFINMVSFWKMHFAEELDILLKSLKSDDSIYILRCNGVLKHGCGIDLDKNSLRCALCQSEFTTAMRMLHLNNKINIIELDLDNTKSNIPQSIQFDTIDELKEFTLDGLDIGSSLASMIISCTRDPQPQLDDKLKQLILGHLSDLSKYINFLQMQIEKYDINRMYVFNGRLPYYRMSLRVGQCLKVSTFVHERGYEINRYIVIENTYPHDLNYIKKQINDLFLKETDFNKKQNIAVDWYDRYVNGRNKAMLHFVKTQNEELDLKLDKSKINVAIFNSSEDEMETIEEWKNIIYRNQNEALLSIIEYPNWNENIHFYLRVHPNLKGISNKQTEYIDSINWDKMTVIPADSPISTYKLIQEADIIVTYSSTVGIESCFRRKPVILAGRASYEDLEGFFKPKNHEELCKWINSFPNCEYDYDQAYISSIKYAWFYNTFGQEFTYFKQTNYNEIKYLGQKNLWSAKYHFTQKLINIRNRLMERFRK